VGSYAVDGRRVAAVRSGWAEAAARALRLVERATALLQQFRQCARGKSGSGVTFAGGNEPTSGLVAVLLLRTLCNQVRLFGLGRSTDPQTPYQYYRLFGTERSKGNAVHSFKAENWLLSTLSHLGRVTWCKPTGCYKKGDKVRLDFPKGGAPARTSAAAATLHSSTAGLPPGQRAHDDRVPVKRPLPASMPLSAVGF
jgi:hypothetical protein